MTKYEAIILAGSQARLARLLGISRGAVHQWQTIPQGRLWQLKCIKPEWFANLEKED
jgi:predicted transcriptional regulator